MVRSTRETGQTDELSRRERAAVPVTVSVIVPAYNEAAVLPDCLAALHEQTVPRETYEVILVDDGSTDPTAAVGAEWGVRVIKQAQQGPAAARNAGARAAHGKLLLFTDADCVPAPDWIAEMVKPFDDATVVGVKGAYRTRQRTLVARFVQIEYEGKYERMQGAGDVDFIDTYAAAYRRDIFLQTGGFDTYFRTASVEDQEFSFRLAEAGHRLVFNPRAVVFHRHPATWTAYWRRKFGVGFWKVRVLAHHPGKAVSDSHTPQLLKAQMGWAMGLPAVALLVGRGRAGRRGLVLWVAGFGLLIAPFVRRAWYKDPVVAVVSPLLLLIRAWALGFGLVAGLLQNVRGDKPPGQ